MRGSSSVSHLASRNSKNHKQGTCGQTGHRTNVTHKEYGRNAKPEVDDVGFEMQLSCNEGFSDENGYMWLSSSGRPPCTQSSVNRQLSDTVEIDLSDALFYYQFSGKPPMSRCDWASFDVDQKNLVPDTPNASSTRSSLLSDRTEGCGGEFGGRCSFSEVSSTLDSSWTSIGTWDEPSPLQDAVSVWLPLFDFGGEEPKWDADGLRVPGQDFLSPSCHRRTNLQGKLSSLSCSPDFDQILSAQVSLESSSSVPNDLLDVKHLPGDSDADEEPLFWPFDRKSYWSTELEWSYLDISPFASLLNVGRPTGSHPSKLFQLRLHQRNKPSLHRKNFQQRCKGRTPLGSTPSQSYLAGHKSTDPSSRITNDIGIGTPPGRSRSTARLRLPPDMARRSLSKKGGVGKDLHRSNPLVNEHVLHQKASLDEYLLEFEADDFRIYLAGEIPIEALLGLGEFDGREGIGRTTAGWSTVDFQ